MTPETVADILERTHHTPLARCVLLALEVWPDTSQYDLAGRLGEKDDAVASAIEELIGFGSIPESMFFRTGEGALVEAKS